ncbi:MAG: carbon storage regulator [bacterium]|nr:carbon storage regulator [bacterium]
MLILSRRAAESICLGDDIVLTIVAVGNDRVRIGVKAPPDIRVLRNELEVQELTIPFPEQQIPHCVDTEAGKQPAPPAACWNAKREAA